MKYRSKYSDVCKMLDEYYLNKTKIKYLEEGILLAEKHLGALKHDLKESNFIIDADRISNTNYDTRVQISDIRGIDDILIDGYERLIKGLMKKQDFISKSRLKIIEIQDKNLAVEAMFDFLDEEEMQVIYNVFGLKKTMVAITMDCYFTKKIVYKRIETALNKMEEFNKDVLMEVV